jgi:hypothetical protein
MAEEKRGFEKEYSDQGFWDKVITHAKAAGKEVIEKALWLYYAAQAPQTPAWAKGVIYGALGYFIFPVDAIPDPTPVVGISGAAKGAARGGAGRRATRRRECCTSPCRARCRCGAASGGG